MKILVVTNDFPPRVGGINYYVDQIMRRFPSGDVTILAPSWPGGEAFDSTYPHHVVRVTSRVMLPTPAVRRRLADLVQRERADVVLFGAAVPLARLGPPVQHATGVPFGMFTHGVEVAVTRVPVARRSFAQLARQALLVTAVSEWSREQLDKAWHPDAPIELLPSGIDDGAFHPGISDRGIRERHDLGERPVIACVSRLVPRKGIDQVVRAIPQLLPEFPDLACLVVGGGHDRWRLGLLARRHGVAEHVVFTGRVPYEDLPAHFRAGNVFAAPCRSRFFGLEAEALGAVYLQAAAVGRPAIAGRSGGTNDAVRHGETGLVVDGRDVAAVAGAILELLRDPGAAHRLGAAGAAWVHRDLTWSVIAERLRQLLEIRLAAAT